LTRKELALVLAAAQVNGTMALLDGTAEYSAPLAALPAIVFPASISIEYDVGTRELKLTGPLATADYQTLAGLSTDAGYQQAIQSLYDQPRTFIDQTLTAFLDPA